MRAPQVTGRYTYRQQRRFGGAPLIILQVEDYGDRGYWNDGKWTIYKGYTWRDATPLDVVNNKVIWEYVAEKPLDTPRPISNTLNPTIRPY